MLVLETWEEDRVSIEVTVNNETFSIMFKEGEPEDNTLNRDLNDVYSISDLIELAYNAGKNGEEFEYHLEDERKS